MPSCKVVVRRSVSIVFQTLLSVHSPTSQLCDVSTSFSSAASTRRIYWRVRLTRSPLEQCCARGSGSGLGNETPRVGVDINACYVELPRSEMGNIKHSQMRFSFCMSLTHSLCAEEAQFRGWSASPFIPHFLPSDATVGQEGAHKPTAILLAGRCTILRTFTQWDREYVGAMTYFSHHTLIRNGRQRFVRPHFCG